MKTKSKWYERWNWGAICMVLGVVAFYAFMAWKATPLILRLRGMF